MFSSSSSYLSSPWTINSSMDPKQNLYELEMECFKIFKAQNPDDFDVAFEIDGKKLYADKYKLSKCSPTFKSMLSKQWLKSDAVKIKNYSHDSFKEFITFIYSGECKLSEENISEMIDIAEFYGVPTFKKACVKYLSEIMKLSNIPLIYQLAEKYSLKDIKESIKSHISCRFVPLLKSDAITVLEKADLKKLIETNLTKFRMEECLEAVYKWAKTRALKKQKIDKHLNLNDAIKEDLIDIVPFFKLEEMNVEFLVKFVVKKSFLFSGEKLSEVLWAARGKVYVKITDGNGKILKGILNCPEMDKVADVIQSQKEVPYSSDFRWNTNQTKPSEPSKITRNDNTVWYLVYDKDGDLAIKHRNTTYETYLLAELDAENGFYCCKDIKIEIFRFS